MDLQISVFLLFILFTAGHSLRCYQCTSETGSCAGQTEQTCPIGPFQCITTTSVAQAGGITTKMIQKGCVDNCQSWSVNSGSSRTNISCCTTDLCNAKDDPDPVPNGNNCYYCDRKSCSNTLSCSGTEDRCITGIGGSEDTLTVLKGCASKSYCDLYAQDGNTEGLSCCEGNLCNSAQSVSQSFLFLCCSLISYFLLH